MMRHQSLTTIALMFALSLLAGPGCIYAEDGETGHYSTPCSGLFYDVLLCNHETGGAPFVGELHGGVDEPRYTCANACQKAVECFFVAAEDQEACTSDCLMDANYDQDVLNCVRDNECNNINACFAGV